MIRTMYRAVKAIKIAIGGDNFCSARIKFRPVILLAFPLFLASCQKLDDGDAASSSLTDALRSETTVRPLDLLTSVDSWQLVSYQQPHSLAYQAWANTSVQFTADSVRFYRLFDVFDDATHSITVSEETLHLLKVDYAEGFVTFFGDDYKLNIPSSGSQHQIELESDNLILTLYDGEPDV